MNRHAATRPPRPSRDFPGWLHEAGLGLSLLGRGLSAVWSRPRVALLGMVPALVASVLLTGVVVAVGFGLDGFVGWLTPFMSGWHPTVAQIVRGVLELALLVGVILLCVMVFASLTMLIGEPIYQRISAWVDRACGAEEPDVETPLKESVPQAIGDAFRGLGLTAQKSLIVALVGLVPVVGSIVAPVLSVVFGGRLMTLDMLSIPMERRGAGALKIRLGWIRYRPALALGFGVPVYLCFLVPVLSVVVFPGVIAGATLLVRELLQQPTRLRPGDWWTTKDA